MHQHYLPRPQDWKSLIFRQFLYITKNMEQKIFQDILIPYNFDVQEIQQQFGIYQKQIKQEREEYEQELKN
ncbi:unnamed protein product [Paramecium primaurelia]|uniref:Uncharacterized protein n=1 Tax=Paramecium primaurelia TaxID=5886 RepID=A0A8S1LS38_PARPR|nr:unnamed protein product [Paramecium primaurelia]